MLEPGDQIHPLAVQQTFGMGRQSGSVPVFAQRFQQGRRGPVVPRAAKKFLPGQIVDVGGLLAGGRAVPTAPAHPHGDGLIAPDGHGVGKILLGLTAGYPVHVIVVALAGQPVLQTGVALQQHPEKQIVEQPPAVQHVSVPGNHVRPPQHGQIAGAAAEVHGQHAAGRQGGRQRARGDIVEERAHGLAQKAGVSPSRVGQTAAQDLLVVVFGLTGNAHQEVVRNGHARAQQTEEVFHPAPGVVPCGDVGFELAAQGVGTALGGRGLAEFVFGRGADKKGIAVAVQHQGGNRAPEGTVMPALGTQNGHGGIGGTPRDAGVAGAEIHGGDIVGHHALTLRTVPLRSSSPFSSRGGRST